ncbi:unnamed protein product [Cryptosporidium hominis]|uniref:Uncharacterized protein n=1 Tax=Cryptosporidium hominis TaxID=237895 RepID=A0A0S4TKK5_CRYHO|nr:hypothetical protein ChTU502y2012_421g0550 [Cryptosporidium hominis]PPA64726.1 hypothetical protein ChUKH1_01585 [Cryptosporidium hominis]PPS98097.1 Uncharacterized protein GY17_00000720 [Cryptosporidium hominis]CUV07834.1 unnamed protein product [Cryptosporidium hominis]|eukprot:PPS98097.1 Uncharacterized protein GY17_00000720 [Cryptosporidium hominis]
MDIYISNDNSELNCNVLPDCTYSLCYVNLALNSQKFGRKGKFKSKSFEFFVTLYKKNLLTNEELQIGSCRILPSNYCTPFERNYCTVYFNFFSIDELKEFLEKNEIIVILKLGFGINHFEVLFDETINYFIKPVTSIKNELFLSNKNNDFEVTFIVNVEWFATIPKIIKNNIENPEKLDKDIPISSSLKIENKILNINIIDNPNISLIYEKTICNDPIISKKIVCSQPITKALSKHTIYKSTNIKNNFFAPSIHSLNNIGNWTVKIKNIILTENGFTFLHDKFPKYKQSKSYKVIVQYCIKNEDGKTITQTRKHWSIMSFLKNCNNFSIDNRIPRKPYYIAKANIYSRIPENITDKIEEKYFHISFSIPNSQILYESKIDKGNAIFYGILHPNEISLTKESLVKLYSEFHKKKCLGYALISFSDIKEKPHDSINLHYKIDRIIEIKNDSNKKQCKAGYLEGMSIIYLYIYWHIQFRAKNERKTPESILVEFYSKISSSKTIEGGVNVTGMNKCVSALIHSNTELTHSLMSYTSCIPENLTWFNNVYELRYYLLFPHLETFENSCNDIFSNNNSIVFNEYEFAYKCNELGIRECISITWIEMMKSSFANISLKAYRSCLQLYKVENIFL